MKYRNKFTEYNGRIYHSKKESEYARDLDLLIKAHEIRSWIPQFKISIDINGDHICNYIADFLVTMKDGTKEIHEVKPENIRVWPKESRLKWIIVKALYKDKYKFLII